MGGFMVPIRRFFYFGDRGVFGRRRLDVIGIILALSGQYQAQWCYRRRKRSVPACRAVVCLSLPTIISGLLHYGLD